MILQESCKLRKHHEPLPHHAEPLRSAIYRRTSRSRETGDGGGEQPVAETEKETEATERSHVPFHALMVSFPEIQSTPSAHTPHQHSM